MKPVKNLVLVALLVLSIALTAVAGDVQVPGVVATPSPTPTPEASRITVSDPEADTTVETADYLFFEVLTALLSVY
jgi:hypothetical protein